MVSVDTVHNDSTVSVTASKSSRKGGECHEANDRSVAMVARCMVDSQCSVGRCNRQAESTTLHFILH